MLRPKVKVEIADKTGTIYAAMRELLKHDVLVGIPAAKAPRQHKENGNANNALIYYIQDNGSPLKGIPKRESLRPGIRAAKDQISEGLRRAGKAALQGDTPGVMRGLNYAGLAAQAAVRNKINTGPFKPLSARTLAARRRRGHKSIKPLVEYGEMRNAINYVVR